MLSVRFLLAVLAFLLTAIQYMQRINMSVAIVCMINNTRLEEIHHENKILALKNNPFTSDTHSNNHLRKNPFKISKEKCAYEKSNKTKIDGPFVWEKSIQGLILSSFFYGYLFTQIVGAWLAIRFGPKIVLVISIFISSIFTLLTPLAARLGYIALFICRFLIGLAHGVVWPSLGGLWPYWVKLLLISNS